MNYILYIISYSILAIFTLIISKVIYSFLKKKTKLSSFSCFLLIIISILIFSYLFKGFIKVIIDLLMILLAVFIYALLEPLKYKNSSSVILIFLFNVVVIFLSFVGLFLILKYNDKISFKENKILKSFTIGLIIVLSSFIVFLLCFFLNNISLDGLLTFEF